MKPKSKKILFSIGFPLSPLYSQIMSLRAYLYRKRILRVNELTIPVISVGNLTMGGTGKTPLVLYLAKYLITRGFKPAVISRGYGGSARSGFSIVSDGKNIFMNPEECGDEPWLHAHEVPGLVVAIGKRRILPCRHVIDAFGCDVILLDDGFQHMNVSRTVDLVLFDVAVFAGNSRVFPGGDLREPVTALERADAFILTGCNKNNITRTAQIEELLSNRFPEKKIFAFSGSYTMAREYSPSNLVEGPKSIAVDEIPPKVLCFCGIANPDRLREMLELYDIPYVQFLTFPDHFRYTKDTVQMLQDQAEGKNAVGLLTTEKDVHKILPIYDLPFPLFTLPLEYNDNETFNSFLDASIENHRIEQSSG